MDDRTGWWLAISSVALVITSGLAWTVWATIEGQSHFRYTGQMKRGARIWAEPLPTDMKRFLRLLSGDIIYEQTGAFIKKQDNTVLIQRVHTKPWWKRGRGLWYIAYVDLRVRESSIEYRLPISQTLGFAVSVGIGILTSFQDARATILVLLGLLLFSVGYVLERRRILKFVNDAMQTYCG